MPINTAKVTNRRQLKFNSYEEMLTEVHSLAAGPCKQLGNWSLGLICQHLATGMHGSIDGLKITPPWHISLMRPLVRWYLLNREMPSGVQLKGQAAVLLVPGDTETAAGLSALEAAVARLARETVRKPSPLLGAMNAAQWDRLHLNHAAMHLSFIERA